ncbi:hypothetical protein [Thermus hydrothermalis]|uniref:hypothetical protein n=1 Tax=Thermus hydrothermalis TaxID=2908148 RepID=UPI001FAA7CFF|nr:hypothetical protein [Thermus hydrothermalis]
MRREEAQHLLQAAQRSAQAARLRLALLGGWYLVLWGGVWALGYLLQALHPAWAGPFFALTAPLATLLTFYLGFRQREAVRSERGLLVFALWGLLALFYLLHWAFLLPPKGLEGQSFLVSLVAFGLALTGVLWKVRELLLGGLGLFLLALLLLRVFPDGWAWGMALVGFLALLLGVRLVWRWTP